MRHRILPLVLIWFLGVWVSGCPGGPPPYAPGDLKAEPISSTTVDLSWTPGDLSDQQVLEHTANGGFFVIVATFSKAVSRYHDTGLAPGTQYFYQLYGTNASGNGAPARASATTFPSDAGMPPHDPTGFTAVGLSSSTIRLQWDVPVLDATGLVLERQDAGSFDLIARPAISDSYYDDTGLSVATSYTYRLRATNDVGTSPGVVATATTSPATSSGSIRLNWTLFGMDPQGSGNPCSLYGVGVIGAEISGLSAQAACSAGTLEIDGIQAGVSALTAKAYFGNIVSTTVADQKTLSLTVSSSQVTQVSVDFQPI